MRYAPSAVLLSLALVGSACGGSSPSTPSSAATSPITKGILLVSQTSDALYGMLPSGLWRIKVPVEVKAMNSISLNLNYARLTLYDAAGAEALRAEVGASELVAQAGTNHVTNAQPLRFTLVFQYVPQAVSGATLLLNATDANGNTLDTTLLRSDFRYSPDPELP